jgi:hypothetical protein
MEIPEGHSLVKTEQLKELTNQLAELREALHNQNVAFRKAMNIISFVKNILPTDKNGNIDVDPMAMMNLLMDKKKFQPILKDLEDVNKYIVEYEQKAVRLLHNG